MTEKEKRDLGMIYNPNYDQELGREIIGCKDKCFAYNQLMPSALEKKAELLREILGKTGENFMINAPFWCDYGYNIEIGENFFCQP